MGQADKSYTPKIPDAGWEHIKDFVMAAVADCDPSSASAKRDSLWACSSHVWWCWNEGGIALTREEIFHPRAIDEFLAKGVKDTVSARSISNLRRHLASMTERLVPSAAPLPRIAPRTTDTALSTPYTDEDVAALRAWATAQTTENRRHNAEVLLALGLGAGLSPTEIGAARIADLHVDEDGVVLRVTGDREREVPVKTEWAPILAGVADTAARPDDFVFRAKSVQRGGNLISHFTDSCNGEHSPNSRRMRNTWIIGHLASGIPVHALMAAAGIESLDGLTKYVTQLPTPTLPQLRNMLTHR